MDKDKLHKSMIGLDREVGWGQLLSLMNPTNVEEEKEKVLIDGSYEPVFRYKTFEQPHDEIEEKISILEGQIGEGLSGLEKDAGLGLMKELRKYNRCIQTLGSSGFQAATEDIFSRPCQEDIDYALKNYGAILPREDTPLSPDDVRRIMLDYISKIPEIRRTYIIEIDAGRENIRTQAKWERDMGRILIPIRQVSWNKMARDLIHEPGRHVVDYEIGLTQPSPLFCIGFPGGAFTREGHALYQEDRVVPDYEPAVKTRAGNIMAMVMAEDESFSNVYNELLNAGFSRDEAFKCTLMAKRGFIDTGKKGTNFNRNLYAKGLRMVKEYLQNRGDEALLYTGRIALEYIDGIKGLEGVNIPDPGLPKRLRNLARSYSH